MIYRFKLVSEEVDGFFREIEIADDAKFLDLRNAVLDSVGYSKDEMDSFFICDEGWNRETEVTLEDMGSASDQDIYLMADTPLYELIEDEGQKLTFVFDYMTERSFYMELKEIITGKELDAPVCTRKGGKAPAQTIDLDDFERDLDNKAAAAAAKAAKEDFDMDFYGDSEYNDDELPEGFDDSFGF